MTKRKKFLITSGLLSLSFLIIYFVDISFNLLTVVIIAFLSLALSFWALKDSLKIGTTLLVLVLPLFFTLGAGLFYFYNLLTSSLVTQLSVNVIYSIAFLYWFLYAVGMYATLLGANIYAVASIRTIALLRAAHAIGFLLTLVTFFFIFDTIWSFRTIFWINSILAGILSFPLILQSLWSIELEEKLSRKIFNLTVVASFVLTVISAMISFWPLTVLVISLFLTSIVYVLLGLSQSYLTDRLFQKTVREYLIVGVIVFVAVYLSAGWGG